MNHSRNGRKTLANLLTFEKNDFGSKKLFVFVDVINLEDMNKCFLAIGMNRTDFISICFCRRLKSPSGNGLKVQIKLFEEELI